MRSWTLQLSPVRLSADNRSILDQPAVTDHRSLLDTSKALPTTPSPRPLFASTTTERTAGTLLRTPTRMHPFSAEVTFGAESFEDYMCQFMCGEVNFKNFRKASIPKFDSSKNDSFVHWYKLFCFTCLQWGVWCPPYESAQEDSIHGKWWSLLPASVREKDAFMSGLIYTALNQESTFPSGSREQGAVEGCLPPGRVPCGLLPVSVAPPPVAFRLFDRQ